MDRNKIDRLFREKMDHLEVVPSSKAWSQVEKQIRPKRTYKMYWMTAAVVLIFASWILWPTQTELSHTPIASEVSYPPLFESPEIDFKKIEVAKVKETPKRKTAAPKANVQMVASNDQIKNKTSSMMEELAPLEIETKTTTLVAEVETPEAIEKIDENVVDFSKVKIIYISSAKNDANEQLQKVDSANTFKKIIAFAEKIDPGEMMADFKSAKDNLLNNGFKKKEKNSL